VSTIRVKVRKAQDKLGQLSDDNMLFRVAGTCVALLIVEHHLHSRKKSSALVIPLIIKYASSRSRVGDFSLINFD
jgi:hypothetical protein